VFCGDKSILLADYLIDDTFRHLERFKGQGILFSAPHNAAVTGFRRVASWREIEDFFLPVGRA
jgi:5'(3')-deoxyribonucleotidase